MRYPRKILSASFFNAVPLYAQRLIVVLLLWASCQPILAQNSQLYLRDDRRVNRTALYQVGEEISFWVEGHDQMVTRVIRNFTDSLIVFDDYRIAIDDISHWYVDDKVRSWYILRYKTIILPIAGAGYILIDGFNTRELAPSALLIGGSLIAGGFLLKWIIGNRIRIRGSTKVSIISL